MAALAATKAGAHGVGIWALGMENDGAQMIASMDGFDPGQPGEHRPGLHLGQPPAPARRPGAGAPAVGWCGTGEWGSGRESDIEPDHARRADHDHDHGAPHRRRPRPRRRPTQRARSTVPRVQLTPVAASRGDAPPSATGSLTAFSTNEPAYACLDGATIAVDWDGLLSSQLVAVAVDADELHEPGLPAPQLGLTRLDNGGPGRTDHPGPGPVP